MRKKLLPKICVYFQTVERRWVIHTINILKFADLVVAQHWIYMSSVASRGNHDFTPNGLYFIRDAECFDIFNHTK